MRYRGCSSLALCLGRLIDPIQARSKALDQQQKLLPCAGVWAPVLDMSSDLGVGIVAGT